MGGSASDGRPVLFFCPPEARVRQITVTATFASTHRDPSEGPHLHGHSYVVAATELGNDAGVKYELLPDLRAILSELHLHSLDEMLIGGSQTLDGIGAWIMERLLSRHQRLVRIDMHTADQPDVVVSVLREIR